MIIVQTALSKIFPVGTFSTERINTRRQNELDIIKGVAIICMVLEHTYIQLLSYSDAKETLFDVIMAGYVTQLLNASIFMISMGISVNYARHNDVSSLALRGVALLSVGQLLNLLRDVIPNVIGYNLTGNIFFLMQSMMVLNGDIMQLAGLTFLLFALLKKLRLKGKGIFLTACGLNLVGVLLNRTQTGSYLVDQLLGFFYPTETESFFPLFNWFIYPAFGYMFGELYLHIKDKDKLYNRIFSICLPLTLVYFVPRYAFDFLHFGDLTQLTMQTGVILPDALFIILIDLMVFGLVYKLSKLFKNGELPTVISFPAKHLNKYFCISWVLISIAHVFLLVSRGKLLDSVYLAFFVALLILATCTLIIIFYERYLRRLFSSIPKPVVLVLFALIWGVSIGYTAWVYPKITDYPNYLNDYFFDSLSMYF